MKKDLVIRLCGKNGGGGARVHIYQLNEAVEKSGVKTTTFIPKPAFEDEHTHTDLVKFDYQHTLSPLKILKVLKTHKDRIAYVHSHLRNASIMGGKLCQMAGLPHVVTIHGPLYQGKKSLKDKLMLGRMRKVLQQAAKVIFISGFVQDETLETLGLEESDLKDGKAIFNGSDGPKRVSAKKKAPPLEVAVVGELTQRKGMEDLLWLVGKLNLANANNIRLHVYGEGEYRERLEKTDYKGLILHGYESDKAVIFADKHLHLILSRNEGFGRVVTEAMAYGVPTICYNKGAFPELIVDGITGILCRRREEVLNILTAIAAKPKGINSMGKMARRAWSDAFSQDAFQKNTLAFLKDLHDDKQG